MSQEVKNTFTVKLNIGTFVRQLFEINVKSSIEGLGAYINDNQLLRSTSISKHAHAQGRV